MTCLGEIREPEKTLTSAYHIFDTIVNQYMKFLQYVPQDFGFSLQNFQLLNLRRKKFIAKILWWLVCISETLKSKALIPNVMKLAPKIEEREINAL